MAVTRLGQFGIGVAAYRGFLAKEAAAVVVVEEPRLGAAPIFWRDRRRTAFGDLLYVRVLLFPGRAFAGATADGAEFDRAVALANGAASGGACIEPVALRVPRAAVAAGLVAASAHAEGQTLRRVTAFNPGHGVASARARSIGAAQRPRLTLIKQGSASVAAVAAGSIGRAGGVKLLPGAARASGTVRGVRVTISIRNAG